MMPKMHKTPVKLINNNRTKIVDVEKIVEVEVEKITGPKISVVMAYYNRKHQTLVTLDGFEELYAKKYNFEVIIVDDNSDLNNTLEQDIKKYSFSINLIVISKEKKGDRVNPGIAYNRGFEQAKGEIIIIQNPECFHIDNIFEDCLKNLSFNQMISYSCYGMNSFIDNNLIKNKESLIDIIYKQNILGGADKTCEVNVGGWLNDKNINPTYYHYCTAIFKKNLNTLGGFSVDFRNGFCYDDDEFVRRAYYQKLDLVISDKLVIHQFHESSSLPVDVKKNVIF